MLETVTRAELRTLEAPAVAPTCDACGAVSAPDGTCLEIGCIAADAAATRGAARSTAKYGAAPAAWNAGGRVD